MVPIFPKHSPPISPCPTSPPPTTPPTNPSPTTPPPATSSTNPSPTTPPQMNSQPTNTPSAAQYGHPPSSPGWQNNVIFCKNLICAPKDIRSYHGDGVMIGDHNHGGRLFLLSRQCHPLMLIFSCKHEVVPSGVSYCTYFLWLIYPDPVIVFSLNCISYS